MLVCKESIIPEHTCNTDLQYSKFFSVEKFGSGKHVLINSYTCFAPVFIRRSCLIRRMMNFKSFAEHLKTKKNKKNLHLYMSKTRDASVKKKIRLF